tara:strand:- start:8395 stop:9282 length:888 start_codon:yes stop_codon:yes gene_type:complete
LESFRLLLIILNFKGMNTFKKYSVLVTGFFIISCTEVIDLEVTEAAPRLVIEASLDWNKGTMGNEQNIQLSTSTPYFDSNSIEIVTGATVVVTNMNNGTIFNFVDQNNGNYYTDSFIPIRNDTYKLEVLYNNETYLAEEIMTPVADIEALFQSTENGFDDEVLEVNLRYIDPAGIDNYYLFRLQKEGALLPDLRDMSDEFTDGNSTTLFFELIEDEEINQEAFVAGDKAIIHFYGISKRYFNYIRLLIAQNESGGPFSTIPVPLRGNCTNMTNEDNYAFGYFRASQVVKTTYTFE